MSGDGEATGTMAIAALERGDRARWDALWGQYLQFYQTTLPDGTRDGTWDRLLDGRELHALAAREGGAILGIVHFLYHPSFWTPDPVCYLQDLFTDPAHRGRGVARALIEAVAADARARGAARVYWLTQSHNAVARALYDKVAQHTGFIRYEMALPPTAS